jgi:4-amino-4-deoxychorismate lyase
MTAADFQLYSSLRYDPLLPSLQINTESWDEKNKAPSPFYILTHHRDRILQAAEHFGWINAANEIRGPEGFAHLLTKLTEAINTQSPMPLKIRALLSHDGSIAVESSPAAPVTETALFPKRIPPPKSAAPMKVSPLTGGALTVGDGDAVLGDPPLTEAWQVVPDTVRMKPSAYTSYKTTNRDMYGAARERVGIKNMTEKREVLIISEIDGEVMEGSLTSVFFWRNGKWTTPPVSSGGQVGTTRRWALEKGYVTDHSWRVSH